MTSYFSAAVLACFLPATVLAYQIAPRRARGAVLLAASYIFFWSISGRLIVFLIASTLSIWAAGLVLDRQIRARAEELGCCGKGGNRRAVKRRWQHRMRLVVTAAVALNLGIIVALKYLAFFARTLTPLASLVGIAIPEIALTIGIPIGISFYSLSAVSYVVDVYRGTITADRNLGRLALFLSFFPQIMEGPIARYAQTAQPLWAGAPVRAENLYAGTVRIVWGMAKKFIVADRVNMLVKTVFENYNAYDGGVIALAAVLYTIQLYCDFSGAMDFALGTGRIFGTSLPENFKQPFSSRTAQEFWQRWHITLGAWFRDYVFYPVSLSGPVKRLGHGARNVLGNHLGPVAVSGVALACVWLANGLWHGAGGQYVLFGLYYFVVLWGGSFAGLAADHVCRWLGIDRRGMLWHAFQRVRTLGVIFIGELIFRATSGTAALAMLGRLCSGFTLASFTNGTVLSLGMDAADFAAVAVSVAVLFAAGALRERGISPVCHAWRRGAVPAWALISALALAVVVFGAYGAGYIPVDPLYAQF